MAMYRYLVRKICVEGVYLWKVLIQALTICIRISAPGPTEKSISGSSERCEPVSLLLQAFHGIDGFAVMEDENSKAESGG